MTEYFSDEQIELHHGDALAVSRALRSGSVDCIVTSPPYFGLRDYGVDGQYGLEESPAEYIETMKRLFSELKRVLADDGTLWINIGDSYSAARTYQVDKSKAQRSRIDKSFNTLKDRPAKNLLGIPWRVAFALQDDGWILRNAIIWHKPNAMPESVCDRVSNRYEMIFLFSKHQKYWFDLDAIREAAAHPDRIRHDQVGGNKGAVTAHSPGSIFTGSLTRNPGDVWSIPTQPFPEAHFAAYPIALPTRCILAGCKPTRTCDCNDIISTPTGTGKRQDDPSKIKGRAGFNRPRRENEGTRAITRREQRHHAQQMKNSPYRGEMESAAGSAFAHYIRTDPSGARPLPPDLHEIFMANGWITAPEPCCHPEGQPGVVLDPFSGSGTTGLAAQRTGRKYIGIDINEKYLDLSLKTRLQAMTLDL